MRLDEIWIRDPFVVPCPERGAYFLFGTTLRPFDGAAAGFDVYESRDLVHWSAPRPAFRPPEGFWADRDFWAPEVHRFGDRWTMLASFKAEGACRATQALVADRIDGPYAPLDEGPLTPCEWECLDGTLFVEDGLPWLVFCHEWLQIGNGTIDAVRLAPDLSRAEGEPIHLFAADAPLWKAGRTDVLSGVTDGPFLHRTAAGRLLMLWSTFGPEGYALGVASSETGRLAGPWRHDHPPLFLRDGGHGMLFRDFGGGLNLAIHAPNVEPRERAHFFRVVERGDGLELA